MEFYYYYNLGKQIAETAIFDGIIHTYSKSIGLLLNNNFEDVTVGFLMFIGITLLILSGLWKLIGKVLSRKATEILN